MSLTAVAFDLDSTLSYYPLSTREVMQQAFAAVDAADRISDFEEAAARYDAAWAETERRSASVLETRRTLFTKLLGDLDPDLCDRLAAAYERIRQESGVRLYDGARRLLDRLKPHVRLGLLTNGSSEMQRPKLRSLGIDSAFDVLVIAGDHGVYKPERQIFDLLSKQLGCPPEQTLFVGDNYEADIRGAHEAGMRTAWLRHPGVEPPAAPIHEIELTRIDELEGQLL